MEAVAKRCDTCIIVVEERQDGTTVPYVFGSNKKRTFPVILLLKNEHFQLIRKREGHAFPVEWEKSGNTNNAYRLQLRGLDDGRQTAHHARDGLRRLKIPIARSSDSGLVKHPVLRMFLPAARRELKCLTKVLRAGSLPLLGCGVKRPLKPLGVLSLMKLTRLWEFLLLTRLRVELGLRQLLLGAQALTVLVVPRTAVVFKLALTTKDLLHRLRKATVGKTNG